MTSPGATRRIATGVLEDLLEHDLLPEITTPEGQAIPTAAVVERLLLGAVDLQRKRTREHGEVVTLTYQLEPTADSALAAATGQV